jgi:hypothetical protein
MNIASGNSAFKQHLANGSKTACNRKMSFGKLSKQEFKQELISHPESCCSKCASKLK